MTLEIIKPGKGLLGIQESHNRLSQKGPFQGHLVQPLCCGQGQLPLNQVACSQSVFLYGHINA